MAEQNNRVLQIQKITPLYTKDESRKPILAVSISPILKPVIEEVDAGQNLSDLLSTHPNINQDFCKFFVNGDEVDIDYIVKNGDVVNFVQHPQITGAAAGWIALVVAVVGMVVGYMMYKSIDQPNTEAGVKLKRITGAKNEAKPYEPIPFILGERVVNPPYAAQPHTYWVGNNQWLKMLVCVGYGPLEVSDIRIGDAPIDTFSDINYSVLDWYNTKSTSSIRDIWNTDTQQDNVNQSLPRASFLTRSAPKGTNKIRLDFSFPQGLWTGGELNSQSNGTMFRFYYKGDRYTIARVGSGGIYEWGERYYTGNIGTGTDLTSYVVNRIGNYAYLKNYNGYLRTTYYRAATRNQFNRSFTWRPIDPITEQPITESVAYEIKRDSTGKPNDGQRGIDIQFTAATYEFNSDLDDSYFGINTRFNRYPVLIAIDVRATDQLSGVIENLACRAKAVTPDLPISGEWKGYSIDDPWTVVDHKNPARMYKWALQAPFNGAAVDNNRINNASIQEWYDTCVDRGWETNEIVNYEVNLKTLLNNIAFTGRAFFSMSEGQFGVIENKVKPNPVQVFTNKNSSGLKSRREFELETDGINYTFANGDFEDQEDDGYYGDPSKFHASDIEQPKPGARILGRYDNMDVWGTTSPSLARTHARFAYFEKELRRETYSLETDIEALVAHRGDKVLVANDIIDVGLGQGFLKSIDGTSFSIDEKVHLVSGNSYALTIRSVSSGVVINTITANYIGDGVWEGSLPTGASVGDLVSYGEAGTQMLECLVTEIVYNDDYSANLTLSNYADNLYTVDQGLLPEYESNLNPVRPENITPLPPEIQVDSGDYSYETRALSVTVSQPDSDESLVSSFRLRYMYWPENETEDGLEGDERVWSDGGAVSANIGVFNVPIATNQGSVVAVQAQSVSKAGVHSGWTDIERVVLQSDPAADVKTLTITEAVDEPKTPDARWSTLTIEIEPPEDQTTYLHAIAEYRQPGQDEFYEIGKLGWEDPNKTTVQVYSDGRQYEIRVRSVSLFGVENKNGISKIITTTNTSDPEYTEDNPFDTLPAPNVKGLEIFEQGNDTEFGGKEAKFTWRKSTLVDWVEIGYEGLKGASSSTLDQYFRDYQIEIIADNKTVRVENVVDNFYTYTHEKNAEDYERRYGVPGAYREFRVSVIMRTRQNQESAKPATLDVSNTPPKALQGLVVSPGFNVIEINYERPTDLDFAGVDIWIETTSGFDPDATTPFATISDNSFVASGLAQDTVYYVRLRPFDVFGRTGTNTTSEIVITTKTGQDLTGLSGWAYEIDPVDRTFIENNLANGAVPSDKVVNLTAAKITTGTLNATETITSEGVIRAVDNITTPQHQTGIGPLFIDGTTYLMWGYDANAISGSKLKFGIDELGNAKFSGDITGSNGTFRGRLEAVEGDFKGNVTLTGDNLWANTRIQVGGETLNSDYVVINVTEAGDGVIETYKMFDGQYKEFKSLTRTESGVANSGDVVTLPGYWAKRPEIQVSPNTVPTYDPIYKNQPQTWTCRVSELQEVTHGKWSFIATSDLVLGSANGTTPLSLSYEGSSDSYTSPAVVTEENTSQVSIKVGLKSVRGTGTISYYQKRKVLWAVGYSLNSVDYAWTTYQTSEIGATQQYVNASRTVNLPSSGKWYIKVEYIAQDSTGTFQQGTVDYQYTTEAVTRSDTVSAEIDSYNGSTVTQTLGYFAEYTPPSGWSVYKVDYSFSYAYYLYSQLYTPAEITGTDGIGKYLSTEYATTEGSENLTNWANISNLVTSDTYQANYVGGVLTAHGGNGIAQVGLAFKDINNTVYLKKPLTNSTTPENGFQFQSFDYQLSTAQIISPGVLNWMAVGD